MCYYYCIQSAPVELKIDVLDDLLERVCVVDGISKARGVHHGQSQLDSPLLDLNRVGVNLNCSLHPKDIASLVNFIRLDSLPICS